MTHPVPRESVAALPSYIPGARGSTDGSMPVKLSSNENPYEPLPSVREVIAQASASVNRYPDMFARDLVEALAKRNDRSEESIAVGAGSVAVLGHALQAYLEAPGEVVYAWRSFEAYPILTRLTGATPVAIPLASGGRHDLEAMAGAVTDRTKAILLCSPNNPTGPAIGEAEFEAFMGAIPAGVLVILDEAYVEFIRDPLAVDGVAALRRHPNLIVARTFSKAYGLAGLRIGYALGEPDAISAIRSCTTPFSLSSVAQAAALASLQAESELMTRVASIVSERERVLTSLRGQGWTIPETQGNFFWISAGEDTSTLATHLRAASPSLLTRPFEGEGVRITIGTSEENDHLTAALEACPFRR